MSNPGGLGMPRGQTGKKRVSMATSMKNLIDLHMDHKNWLSVAFFTVQWEGEDKRIADHLSVQPHNSSSVLESRGGKSRGQDTFLKILHYSNHTTE